MIGWATGRHVIKYRDVNCVICKSCVHQINEAGPIEGRQVSVEACMGGHGGGVHSGASAMYRK